MKNLMIMAGLALLAGCMSVQKATRYLKKEGRLATVCAAEYPVQAIDTMYRPYDSTAIIKALDSTAAYSDSIWNEVLSRFVEDCNKYRTKESDYLPYTPSINLDSIIKTAKRKANDEAQRLFNSLPPKEVEIKVRDRAMEKVLSDQVFTLQNKVEDLTIKADQLEQDKNKLSKIIGYLFAWFSRQWWFWLLIVAGLAYISKGLWLPKIPFTFK